MTVQTDQNYLAVLEVRDVETAEITREYCVALEQPVVELLTLGEQGPPGPAGEPGPEGGTSLQRLAGEVLSALRVVYELDGVVRILDYRDAAHIDLLLGITLTAADPGIPVNVQRTGVIEDNSWTWTPGPVWLGTNGDLTQIPPADGYDVLLGAAMSATRITLDLQPPIQLE
ncbi:hypothetical protein [Pseudomonas indica]|uniref:Uncharacterized protein n=1 Tax=Pseudomonas indica TaxID=137658 RepID=A0A1G8V925_9PSED|nr:hypothetical protein [Pseudomonas indica]SDJ61660.1 hypothetical protein SAMN05216186_102115 [Pseudomonas indica]